MLFTRPTGPGSRPPFAVRRSVVWLPVEDDTDLQSQLEDLLSHVRRCEKWARLDDRLDLLGRLEGNR
jgi:hypothetical protein